MLSDVIGVLRINFKQVKIADDNPMFSKKILVEISLKKIFGMKYQVLFSGENKKNVCLH